MTGLRDAQRGSLQHVSFRSRPAQRDPPVQRLPPLPPAIDAMQRPRHVPHIGRVRARESDGMSSLLSSGRAPLPLHRRNRERRSLARADPAGRGASAWIGQPVGRTPTVGHFQGDVFVEWSAVDWKPSIIVFEHPHCRCPFESLRRPLSIRRDARQSHRSRRAKIRSHFVKAFGRT